MIDKGVKLVRLVGKIPGAKKLVKKTLNRIETRSPTYKKLVGRYKGLTKKDKKVVDAFYSGKKADSNLLTSTGKTLQKEGMGSQKIATRTKDDGFKITAKMDSKSTQSIVNYINKSFPKDTIKKTVKKKNKGGLLVTPKLAQRGF